MYNEVTQSKQDKTHAINFIHNNIFVCIYYVNTVQWHIEKRKEDTKDQGMRKG